MNFFNIITKNCHNNKASLSKAIYLYTVVFLSPILYKLFMLDNPLCNKNFKFYACILLYIYIMYYMYNLKTSMQFKTNEKFSELFLKVLIYKSL